MRGLNSYSTLGLKNPTTLSITDGVITVSQSSNIISSQTGTEDDLDTISIERASSQFSPFVVLKATSGHTITLTTNGNFAGDSSIEITSTSPAFLLYSNEDSLWYPLGSGGGGGSSATIGMAAISDSSSLQLDGGGTSVGFVPFDLEVFDTNNFFDSVTDDTLITIPTGYDGIYSITFFLWIENSSAVDLGTNDMEFYPTINGLPAAWNFWEYVSPSYGITTGDYHVGEWTFYLDLVASDEVQLEFNVLNASANSVNISCQVYFFRIGDRVGVNWSDV